MPQRHYLNRFTRHFRTWTQKYIDVAHSTTPLVTNQGGGFKYPGLYIGQYGAYEAVSHIYKSNPSMSHLVTENSVYVSNKYF